MRNVFYFSKKVRLFSQNDVLFLFYFLINPAGTTDVGEKKHSYILSVNLANTSSLLIQKIVSAATLQLFIFGMSRL